MRITIGAAWKVFSTMPRIDIPCSHLLHVGSLPEWPPPHLHLWVYTQPIPRPLQSRSTVPPTCHFHRTLSHQRVYHISPSVHVPHWTPSSTMAATMCLICWRAPHSRKCLTHSTQSFNFAELIKREWVQSLDPLWSFRQCWALPFSTKAAITNNNI